MSKIIDGTPWARKQIDAQERNDLEARARALGVRAIWTGFNSRLRVWNVTVFGEHITELHGAGALAAIIAGALDDHEAAA